jgi:hypothetical protein
MRFSDRGISCKADHENSEHGRSHTAYKLEKMKVPFFLGCVKQNVGLEHPFVPW